MKKISVIIPCYNAQKYIDRCMDCLQKQTIGMENLEIILINDGSTDATLGKLMLYEQKYPEQILLVNCEKNQGQGAAKNIGIRYASADYIGFLDVDDVIADSFYEKLYRKITEGDYDWVSAKFIHIPPEEKPDFSMPPLKKDREYHRESNECMLFQKPDEGMCNGSFGALPARLFRRSFITEHEILFPEGLMYEDNYWGAKCGIFTKNACILDEALYCYYKNTDSVVSSRNALYHLDRMKIEEMIVELLKEQGLFERFYKEIEGRFIRMYYCGTWLAVFLKMDTIPDILSVMKQRIYELFPNYRENSYVKRLSALDQMLLKLLDDEEGYTVEELEVIKDGYVKDFLRLYG